MDKLLVDSKKYVKKGRFWYYYWMNESNTIAEDIHNRYNLSKKYIDKKIKNHQDQLFSETFPVIIEEFSNSTE